MPNAQTHLAAACDLLDSPAIQHDFPWLAEDSARSAFLLGAISPDARVVSGQPREATHFFLIPFEDQRPAQDVMLAAYPDLRQVSPIKREKSAFIAGYITHLVMDQTWVEMVVMQGLFIEGAHWGTQHPQWRTYCILMTHMEYGSADRLPIETLPLMARARPDGWLPFIEDHHLAAWRDRLGEIVQKGGAKLISSLLAQSCGLSPDEMEAIVQSEERMATEAFAAVSRRQLLAFEEETARRSEAAIVRYLSG